MPMPLYVVSVLAAWIVAFVSNFNWWCAWRRWNFYLNLHYATLPFCSVQARFVINQSKPPPLHKPWKKGRILVPGQG